MVQPWQKLFMHYLQFALDNAEPCLIETRIIRIVLYHCIIKKNIEVLLDASKEVGLEVNREETICSCLVTRLQNAVKMKR
jgi:hypothetical protein